MTAIKYKIETLSLDANGGSVQSDCADITFINFGDNASPPTGATLIVDDVVKIKPGEEYIIAANSSNEINTTKHRFSWDTTTGTNKTGVVVRKILHA